MTKRELKCPYERDDMVSTHTHTHTHTHRQTDTTGSLPLAHFDIHNCWLIKISQEISHFNEYFTYSQGTQLYNSVV